MDTYRDRPSDFDLPSAPDSSADDVAAAIGTDERRMHVRAYNYWAALLDGRDFPSIEELEPADVQDFAENSLLLDFTCGRDNPAMPYIGAAIRDECGLDDSMRTTADVPSRSLLSRLTDHYLQIIANRAPIGFEAEFLNQREENICYRGILMPFSSDGDTIDFIYGVINWKKAGEDAPEQSWPAAEPAAESADEVLELTPEPEAGSDEAPAEELDAPSFDAPDEAPEPKPELAAEDEPFAPTIHFDPPETVPEAIQPAQFSWEDEPLTDDDEVPEVRLDENAGLADRLWAARETAEAVKAGEGRTRAALYKALSLAYDFAVAAHDNPDDYAELLEESGVKAQARAPMTPIAKLVFGIDYDKARLTEFAAALSHGQRQQVELGGFQGFIGKYPGGLKGVVAAERDARRPEPRRDTRGEAARAKLRSRPAMSLADVPGDQEFALVVTRLGPDGRHEPVAVVDDPALVERAIRKAR